MDEEVWYFTFGCSSENAKKYVCLKGTFSEARREMFLAFSDQWAFQYDEETGRDIVKRFNLQELVINKKEKEDVAAE